MSAEKIKQIRETLGLSQAQFGERIGANKFKISRLETGETKLDLDTARAVAQEFGVSYAQLLGLEGQNASAHEIDAYEPTPSDEFGALITDTRKLFCVRSNGLDALEIKRGDVLLVDVTITALERLKPFAPCVVEISISGAKEGLRLLRQFLPPQLLATNSHDDNLLSVSLNNVGYRVVGQVITRLQRAPKSWGVTGN